MPQAAAVPAEVIDPAITDDKWLEEGQKLAMNHHGSYWQIGDWFLAGKDRKKEVIQKAVALTGLKKRTLRGYAEVARLVKSGDRSPFLSFKHHEAVKDLKSEEQRKMLEQAVVAKWSDSQLREVVKGNAPTKAPKVRGAITLKEGTLIRWDGRLYKIACAVESQRSQGDAKKARDAGWDEYRQITLRIYALEGDPDLQEDDPEEEPSPSDQLREANSNPDREVRQKLLESVFGPLPERAQ